MISRQNPRITLLLAFTSVLLLSGVVTSVKDAAAQSPPIKANQATRPVPPPPVPLPLPDSKDSNSPPAGAGARNLKDGETTPAAEQQPPVEERITKFGWVFGLMTGILILIAALLTAALVNITRTGKWSLGDALSEESSIQPPPSEIHSKSDVITFASASRLIALAGMLCAVPVVIGVAYAIVWNLIVNGKCPDLSGVRTFLTGISLTFAPYLANQVRSVFDPGLGSKPASPSTPLPAPQPVTPVPQGQGPISPLGPLPQPTPVPGAAAQMSGREVPAEVEEQKPRDIQIEEVEVLKPYLEPLRSLGYRTTDHFVGAALAAATPLAEHLEIKPAKLRHLVKMIPHRADLHKIAQNPLRKLPLGASLESFPGNLEDVAASGLAETALPPNINLIEQMSPVREQGSRQTCVAFAAVAVKEQYDRLQNQYVPLSEQFLYWDCKQVDRNPQAGTYLYWAMPLLQRDGCCLDSTWNYVDFPSPGDGDDAQGPPPTRATFEAANHRITTFHDLVRKRAAPDQIVPFIKSELARDRCVAFTIKVFPSWLSPDVQRSGECLNPSPQEQPIGSHSMCFVGYEDDTDDVALGGGKFLLRNSLENWGTQSVLGVAGYGTISYSYITNFCIEGYSIE
jgi:C1A family cysteine protease